VPGAAQTFDFPKRELTPIEGWHPVVDRPHRCREVIGRSTKVDGEPIAEADGAVSSGRIGGDQEIFDVRSDDVGQRQKNHFFGKMHEAVAAKQQVSSRKHVPAEITGEELALRTAVADSRSLDQSRNDVASDVAGDRKVHLGHPMKVTARQIEQGADVEIGDQFGKGLSQSFGVVQGGPATRDRLLIAPDVAPIDFAEDLAWPATEIANHLRA
jgi:hypothetical protein